MSFLLHQTVCCHLEKNMHPMNDIGVSIYEATHVDRYDETAGAYGNEA